MIEVIDDDERIRMYGTCHECGAPRDVYEVERANGSKEMRIVCTASVGNPMREEWGHAQ